MDCRALSSTSAALWPNAAPGGMVVLSGILNAQATGVEGVYRGWGFARRARTRDGDWTTLILRRL